MHSKPQNKRLYRSKSDQVVGGVCAGIAEYFAIDPVIVRIMFALAIFMGYGLIAYLVLWVVVPLEGTDKSVNIEGVIEQGAKDIEKKVDAFAEKIQNNRNINIWVGIFIILFGLYFLLGNFGFFNIFKYVRLDLLWPVILIIVGISLLLKHDRRNN